MRPAAVIAPALLLTGCGTLPAGSDSSAALQGPPEGLQLTVEPRRAAAGITPTLSIFNGTAEAVGYNLCLGGIEKLRGGLWVPAFTPAKACPQVFYTLEPGQQASAEALIRAALRSGEYRFVTELEAPLGRLPQEQIRSNPISIAGAGDE